MTLKQIVEKYKKHPIGITAVCVGIIFATITYVRYGSMPTLTSEVDMLAKEADRLKTNLVYASSLQENYDALIEANRQVKGRLIKPDNLAINLQYFYKIESDVGVKYTNPPASGVQSKTASKTNYVAMPYTLSVAGSYKQIIAFIRKIEGGGRYSVIKSAFISQSEETGTDKGKIFLTIGIDLLGDI